MKKFGTFSGVFIPSYEAILGAVLFLLLPHLVAEVGVLYMVIIVVISNLVTTSTAFSIGDCASNLGNVGAGGMYAVSKRSLGKAFGGSIGIQLFLAQAASIGFYAMGFATPLQEILVGFEPIADFVAQMGFSVLQQKQILAVGIALIGFVAGLIGADFIVKIQFVIFIILTVSVGSFFVAPLLGISDPGTGKAVFGSTMNFLGSGTGTYTFFIALTTFFPAVTGIDAGVGMSGSLKNPSRSLTRGTFFAIAITFVVYVALTTLFGYLVAEPLLGDQSAGELIIPSTTGLFLDSPIIYALLIAGILFATGSSALSYFMTAPRTAQALAQDNLLPRFLGFLGRDFTKSGKEPRFATILTLVIVLGIIAIGDVNVSSRVVGIAFLVVYGWINLAAFFERISGNPSFRPTTKGHWSISLFGFVLSMTIIALDSLLVGGLVILSQIIIFLLLLKYKSHGRLEGVWWGLAFQTLGWGFSWMKNIIQGTKNWRPLVGVFVFADTLHESDPLLEISERISRLKGMTFLNLLKGSDKTLPEEFSLPEGSQLVDIQREEFTTSITSIMQAAQPGGLSLNSALLPLDKRIYYSELVERLINMNKNVLLYKSGKLVSYNNQRIDIWWKGEENGNLMALLAFIITQSDREMGKEIPKLRFLRKIRQGEDKQNSEKELQKLIISARLKAETLIIQEDERSFGESLRAQSEDASLILLGMPGQKSGSIGRFFQVDKLAFKNEMKNYDDLPPILFVKASGVMSLIDE